MLRRMLWLLGTALALGSALWGQTANTGALSGTVRDRSQAVIPGVGVRLAHLGTQEQRETVTDETGSYAVGFLAPGRYRVEFALAGFKTVVREGVTVKVTERVVVNEILEVAEQQETVTVSAEAEMLQTDTTALGRVVDSRQMSALPLATRNFTQLTALSPGASITLPDTLAVGNGSQNVFTNGASQLSNSYTINGTDAMNPLSNSAALDFAITGIAVPSVETIEEFKVQTALYDASFGRNAGASINVVTKSGTSEFHGGVYEFHRNDALNANNFFFNSVGADRPVLRQHQFGGTLGGPIVRERTFFFVSYEGMRQLNGASLSSVQTLRLPPVPQDRSAKSLGAVFGGQRGRFGGLAIAPDGSNIHPVALKMLNRLLESGEFMIPSPQRTGPGVNYAVSIPAEYDQDQFNINIDHQFSTHNRLTGKYFFSTSDLVDPFFQSALPGFPSFVDNGNQNISISDLHIFGAGSTNEARAGYTRASGSNRGNSNVTAAEFGIARSNQDQFPELGLMNILGVFQFGGPTTTTNSVANTFTFSDTFSFAANAKGRHDFHVGSETRRIQINFDLPTVLQQGALIFQSFPDFLIGRAGGPLSAGSNGTPLSNVFATAVANGFMFRGMRQFDQSFFIADTWRVHSRLTLNLGLRWDFIGAPWDNRGITTNFDLRLYQPPQPGGASSAGFIQPEGTESPIPGIPQVQKTFLDSQDRNNFAPRFGFAFRPWSNGRLVLRGGYGIFYDRIHSRPLIQGVGFGGPPFFKRIQLAGPANSRASLSNPFPPIPALSDFPIPLELRIPSPAAPPLAYSILDPTNRIPYVQHYSLNIQYGFSPNLLFEVGYVGSKGTRLFTNRLFNQALLASPSRPVNGQTVNLPANALLRAPILGFAVPGEPMHQTTGTSNFNSLQASLTKRFGQGLSFLASYTYSKALSTVSTGSASGLDAGFFGNGAQDDTNIRGDGYGPTNFDRTHRWVLNYIYDLPTPKGSGTAQSLLGGWQVSGILTIQSGVPFSITDSRGGSLYGLTGSRASFAPGADIAGARGSGSVHSRLNQYLNTKAFVPAPTVPAGGQTPDRFLVAAAGTIFGNTGRNIFRGPDQRNLDLALIKRVHFREATYLEFRSDFFNVFNTVNFGLPGTNVSAPDTFGVISSTSAAPRVIQFALKLHF